MQGPLARYTECSDQQEPRPSSASSGGSRTNGRCHRSVSGAWIRSGSTPDLTILAELACALARARASQRSRAELAAYHRNWMATEPPAKRGRLPRRPRHFAPYRLARFILVVLALIGVAALALLVLGLLDVEVVTDHFHIH